MNKYRLRAECQHDVNALAHALKEKDESAITTAAQDKAFPDCEVQIFTALTLSEVRNIIAGIDDGHVMLETVNMPEAYDGERHDWQQISTAPKDGRQILVCDAADGTMGVAWWCTDDRDWLMGEVWDGDRSDIPLRFTDPTHWMPLPDPPKRSQRLS